MDHCRCCRAVLHPAEGNLWAPVRNGRIFPLALARARPLKEDILSKANPLSRLIGMSVLMVNLLWALHLTRLMRGFEFFPAQPRDRAWNPLDRLSWIKDNSVGLVQAILRIALVTALWWLIPHKPIAAVAMGVVGAYLYSIAMMSRQPLRTAAAPQALEGLREYEAIRRRSDG